MFLRENFVKKCFPGKIRLLAWQLEQIADEIPFFSLRLQEFANDLQEKLDLATFKFCFVVGSQMLVSAHS